MSGRLVGAEQAFELPWWARMAYSSPSVIVALALLLMMTSVFELPSLPVTKPRPRGVRQIISGGHAASR
jgi:hypothetical protein